MKKLAFLIIGKHQVGKSHFIREILKPKLGMGKEKRTKEINTCSIIVLLQTPKERGKNVEEVLKNYSDKTVIIIALRPEEVERAKNYLLKNQFEIREIYIEKNEESSSKEVKANLIRKEIEESCSKSK